MCNKKIRTHPVTIPWWQPQIGKEEYRLIKKVLKNNFPNEGSLTAEFEQHLGKLLGVRYVVAVTSATAALFLSLKALGIGFCDEVIVPDLTFIATANAVEMSGAKAILVDVDPKTLTMDIQSFAKAITKRTKCVIPVHVSGRAAALTAIDAIAKREGIFMVEDAAEAFMSKYHGNYLGTFGSLGCFSLSPAKIITTGQGGFIVTESETLYQTVKELKDQGRRTRGTGGNDIHYRIGYNFKYTDLQAALGLGQIQYIKLRMQRIKRTYNLYKRHLAGVKGISVFSFAIDDGELPLWIDAAVTKRDSLATYLQNNGIECRRFWYPIHQQVPYQLPDNTFPQSTRIARTLLWLPSAYTLSDENIKTVCNHIRKFLAKTPDTL